MSHIGNGRKGEKICSINRLTRVFFFLYNSALALTFDLQTRLKAPAQPLPKGILWTKYQIRQIVDS